MTFLVTPGTNGIKKTIQAKVYPAKPIFEIITNGFFTVDQKWTVKSWNKAAERLLGVPAKDIIGYNLWEKFASTIPLNFYSVYHKAFLQDIPVHFEEYWGEMGAWFDVITWYGDDTLSVSFKSTNPVVRLEEYPGQPATPAMELKMLNELYRFVTEVTNDCLWEWDLRSGEIFWIDGGHKRAFGYAVENALVSRSFWESCLHPDDKLRIVTRLDKIIADGSDSIWEDEYRFKKADGSYANVHDRAHIIYEGKKASRMIGATQDITARKSAEYQLLESERKLALIARQTVNSLIITDIKGKITWVNAAFTKMTGYEAGEVTGKKPGSFLYGKDTDPATIQYLNDKIKAKTLFDCEILNYHKSGASYWVHIQGQPILDEKGNCERYFSIQTDITEKVLLEIELAQERLTKQHEITNAVLAAQDNERAEIGKELHDNLNQILAVAILNIKMAKTEKKDQGIYLDKSADFIVEVIEEIRRISKTMAIPVMHIIGLFNSIKDLLDEVTRVHPVKIEFEDIGITEEDLDEKMQLNIFRIVQEQLNNILKHSAAKHASVRLSRKDDNIILTMSDNGVGCDLLTKKHGVGMINIKSRVALYHGSFSVVSNPGKGYELKAVLPLQGNKI